MTHRILSLFALVVLALGCANDADQIGVASECTETDDCPTYTDSEGDEQQLVCLTQFTGGYCGIEACTEAEDCPEGSICVAHDDGTNYCFRMCIDKSECNVNRSPDAEANCSANFTWADDSEDDGSKACIPPSSGV